MPYNPLVLWRANSLSLPAGFIISVMLHLLVIAPVLAMAMTHSPSGRSLLARFDKEAFREPLEEDEPEQEQDLQLGIDEGVSSTLTWIGYEEYQKHLAQLSEVEQAALTDDPAGGAPAAAFAAPPPAPEVIEAQTPVEAQAQTEQQMAAAAAPEQAEATATEPPPAVTAESAPTELVLPASVDEHLMPLTGPEGTIGQSEEPADEEAAPTESAETAEVKTPDAPRAQSWLKGLLETVRRAAEQMQSQPAPQTPPQTMQPPVPPTPPAPPNRAQPQTQPAQSGVNQGDRADKESDPTSTIEVPMDQIEAGKPLAAKGLELKPRKPVFTHLILLTAAPGNPLVEIRFTSTGIPSFARIVESSGNPNVDECLLDSLYGWTAAGKPLTELKGKRTIDVQIRIILNRRARR